MPVHEFVQAKHATRDTSTAFREQLAAARVQTEEWRRRVQITRDMGDEEVAAHGQRFVDENQHVAVELEREFMTQTAAREALERRLAEARDRLAASPARQRVHSIRIAPAHRT